MWWNSEVIWVLLGQWKVRNGSWWNTIFGSSCLFFQRKKQWWGNMCVCSYLCTFSSIVTLALQEYAFLVWNYLIYFTEYSHTLHCNSTQTWLSLRWTLVLCMLSCDIICLINKHNGDESSQDLYYLTLIGNIHLMYLFLFIAVWSLIQWY
jgi:hypothetical protein